MDMRLEVVVLPVSDVDRAKEFYEKRMGFRLDADVEAGEGYRVVQLTPPGSGCSVIFGAGLTTAEPGSAQGLQLVVSDIGAARDELAGRGVKVSEVFHDATGVFHHARRRGPRGRTRAGAGQLRVLRVVQRPGGQRMVRTGSDHPASGAMTLSGAATADAGGDSGRGGHMTGLHSRCAPLTCEMRVRGAHWFALEGIF